MVKILINKFLGLPQLLVLAIATFGSLALSVGGTEIMLQMSASDFFKGGSRLITVPVGILAMLFWLASYAIPFIFSIYVVNTSIKKHSLRTSLLNTILACYVSLIFVFSGIFYSIASLGDYNDAVSKFIFYESRFDIYDGMKMTDYHRSFVGIDHRRWQGVEEAAVKQYSEYNSEREFTDIPMAVFRKAADNNPSSKPISNVTGGVFLYIDCLTYSISNMTTIGFSGISAKSWDARLSSSIQALSAIFLIAVSIGRYFNQKDSTENNA